MDVLQNKEVTLSNADARWDLCDPQQEVYFRDASTRENAKGKRVTQNHLRRPWFKTGNKRRKEESTGEGRRA